VPVESLHDLKTTSLQGAPADLADYRGTVVLAVNVASECGLTPQYKGLQALHEELAPRGFSVLGFPSNDFGGQEPGSAEQIESFCQRNYGVTFPMFTKQQTKAGPGQSPIYTFLTRTGQAPTWNFGKYLIGKDGQVIRFFPSDVTPDAPALRDAIEQALSS
jgi:glutathione peroxidase